MGKKRKKVLDKAGIVRDAIFRQLSIASWPYPYNVTMALRRTLVKAALLGSAVYWAHCSVLMGQITPNPSNVTTLVISYEMQTFSRS